MTTSPSMRAHVLGYRDNASDLIFVVGGRRSKARICLLHDQNAPAAKSGTTSPWKNSPGTMNLSAAITGRLLHHTRNPHVTPHGLSVPLAGCLQTASAAHIRTMENEPSRSRAGNPLELSAETRAVPPIRIAVGIGHTYKDKADGTMWTLSALSSGRTVVLSGDGEIRDRVSLDDLADNDEHVDCDHDNHCCIKHRTHVMPHRGCMLR